MIIMGLVMLIMIRVLSNAAIEYDIKQDLRKEIEKNLQNVSMENRDLKISEDFLYENDNVHFLIIDNELQIVAGEYSDNVMEELQNLAIKNKTSHAVICDGEKYYVRDVRIQGSGIKNCLYIRGFIRKADVDSSYRAIELISYLCIVGVLCIILICELFLSKRISTELKNMCQTAEQIGSNLDMSQRIKYNNQFKEIAVLAQANNRMLDRMEQTFQMQEQFTSDVAHELRTPVSVVMAQCQYARGMDIGREGYEEALEVIYRQSRKIEQIITQLLNFSRLDQDRVQLQEELLDLVEIVESVCESIQEKAQGGILLRLHMQDAVTVGDIGLIIIVVQNLVTNAIKFSEKGGQVDVSTGTEQDWVYVKVRDYGIGIEPEHLESIFRRFYQCDTSRNAEGFGLGLPLCEKIAQKHGGRIEVVSEVGKGSAFTLYLPQK